MRRGFTLIELCVVLVVIGLIAGGVLVGQSMIHAAQNRAIISEYQRYSGAIQAFRDKYSALPGDMNNATTYWGSNCAGTAGVAGTCNGNGNGAIEYGTAPSLTGEAFTGWQQLALAGLVDGSFTGLAGPIDKRDYVFGTNSPASKVKNVGWGLAYTDNSGAGGAPLNTVDFDYDYTNWLTIGADDGIYADDPFLPTADAYEIDSKLDDGMPAQGKVHSYMVSNCTNAASASDHTATYQTNNGDGLCSLYFKY